ncbi:hypothetical protein V8E36_006084 [Tilletia maclaganii]
MSYPSTKLDTLPSPPPKIGSKRDFNFARSIDPAARAAILLSELPTSAWLRTSPRPGNNSSSTGTRTLLACSANAGSAMPRFYKFHLPRRLLPAPCHQPPSLSPTPSLLVAFSYPSGSPDPGPPAFLPDPFDPSAAPVAASSILRCALSSGHGGPPHYSARRRPLPSVPAYSAPGSPVRTSTGAHRWSVPSPRRPARCGTHASETGSFPQRVGIQPLSQRRRS